MIRSPILPTYGISRYHSLYKFRTRFRASSFDSDKTALTSFIAGRADFISLFDILVFLWTQPEIAII
jgi:hypothetical protein